jgi:RNA polymerase sigma-70 factor (ECF subfamily)
MEEFLDSELIKQYFKGDEKALDILVQRYFKQVFFFAKTYVKNDAEAEDVTQEVFVKAWKNLNKFEPDKKFKTWLFQITKNTSIDFLRKHKNFVSPESLDEQQMAENMERIMDKTPLPEELFQAAEFSQKLDEVLACLPKIYETVVVLHLQQDLTFQEISEVLDESINTIKSRYRRALLMIREDFERRQA